MQERGVALLLPAPMLILGGRGQKINCFPGTPVPQSKALVLFISVKGNEDL